MNTDKNNEGEKVNRGRGESSLPLFLISAFPPNPCSSILGFHSLFKPVFSLMGIVLLISGCSTTNQTSSPISPKTPHWITLFDGKSTEAWRGYKRDSFPDKAWKIEEGTLASIVGGEVVDVTTKEEFENFELELDWKISPGGNSGIIYHVLEEYDQPGMSGPEMQVLDDSKHPDGKNPKTSAGALYGLIEAKNKTLSPVGEWNHVRVIVNHNHVEHWLNGAKVVEYNLNSPELDTLIAGSKFAAFPRFAKESAGHICLQHHWDAVWYRTIRLRRL
jgi:hypothetical protein